MLKEVTIVWCKNCNIETNEKVCPVCGTGTVEDVPVEIYWCKECATPIIHLSSAADKGICPICGQKTRYLSSDLRPVFPEERLLLAILLDKEPTCYMNCSVWAANSRYYIDGKALSISLKTYTEADTDRIAERVTSLSDSIDYNFFNENVACFVKAYAMELFFKTGHVATLKPEFINHSPEQFAYFDNRTDVSLTREQRSLFKAFNNVSRLFSVNRCVFFSINLLTSKVNRSQAAHDIHTMIHPVVEADGTICLFCHDDEVMLSFLGFGLRCILSDWYPMADENETLLEKLDIANFSIVRGTDYFSDMIYLLARNYYQSGQPSTYELIPIDFISRAGVDEIDREALNQYVQDQLNAPLYEYGDDYVEYDESAQTQNTDIGADLDLMLLEMDDEDDNPFGEDIEPEDDLDDDDEFFDEDAESENKDEYEFDDIDPEIFRDPLLMVKWLNRHTQNQS